MGRYAEAHELLQQSLSIARELNDGSRVVVVLQLLGLVELALGKPEAALACCEEAVALARTASNKRTLAAAMNTQAQVLRAQGALDRAYPLYTEFVSLARELRDDESVAIGLLNLAMVAVLRDQPVGGKTTARGGADDRRPHRLKGDGTESSRGLCRLGRGRRRSSPWCGVLRGCGSAGR